MRWKRSRVRARFSCRWPRALRIRSRRWRCEAYPLSRSSGRGSKGAPREESMSQLQEERDDESKRSVDERVDSPAREGLTGTTPADAFATPRDPEMFTRPPDGRPLHFQPQWRKDFPIDWPQDHYVARRDFAKFLCLTSLAFAIGQIWIGLQNIWRRHRGAPPIVKIASLSSLPVGGSVVFQYPEAHDDCILIRTTGDKLLAYSQKCTHLSCAVIPDIEKG